MLKFSINFLSEKPLWLDQQLYRAVIVNSPQYSVFSSTILQGPLCPSFHFLCPSSTVDNTDAWYFLLLLSISVSTMHTHTHRHSEKVLAMQWVCGRAAALGSNAERAQLAHDWPSADTDPDSLLRANPTLKHTHDDTDRDDTAARIHKQKDTATEECVQGQQIHSRTLERT